MVDRGRKIDRDKQIDWQLYRSLEVYGRQIEKDRQRKQIYWWL